MERVGVLINRLQEQLQQNADAGNMLMTAQMLQTELLLHTGKLNGNVGNNAPNVSKPAVIYPQQFTINPPQQDYKPAPKLEPEPAPVSEPQPEPGIQLPEETPAPTPKPEPEPIPHFVEQKPWDTTASKPSNVHWSLDPMMDVPTLAHQEKTVYELNETLADEKTALNDRLKENRTEMGAALQETPIHDLKKAISINDRHIFITELFRGDETMYERSIKTINGFNIFPEAEYWIQRELKVKLGWDLTLPVVKVFDQLVKRRFA